MLAFLERRREAVREWNETTEAQLTDAARQSMVEAGRQFAELADDVTYWATMTDTILKTAVPRYLKLARDQHAHELAGYGLWRRGDWVSRVGYAVGGLLGSVFIFRVTRQVWLEPLPVLFFLFGPLLPDVVIWNSKRKFRNQLDDLAVDMRAEEEARKQYRPLTDAFSSVDSPAEASTRRPDSLKER